MHWMCVCVQVFNLHWLYLLSLPKGCLNNSSAVARSLGCTTRHWARKPWTSSFSGVRKEAVMLLESWSGEVARVATLTRGVSFPIRSFHAHTPKLQISLLLLHSFLRPSGAMYSEARWLGNVVVEIVDALVGDFSEEAETAAAKLPILTVPLGDRKQFSSVKLRWITPTHKTIPNTFHFHYRKTTWESCKFQVFLGHATHRQKFSANWRKCIQTLTQAENNQQAGTFIPGVCWWCKYFNPSKIHQTTKRNFFRSTIRP